LMAMLLLSVAPLVKMISLGDAPMSEAISPRAFSTAGGGGKKERKKERRTGFGGGHFSKRDIDRRRLFCPQRKGGGV